MAGVLHWLEDHHVLHVTAPHEDGPRSHFLTGNIPEMKDDPLAFWIRLRRE